MKFCAILATCLIAVAPAASLATPLTVSSYSMNNGAHGSFDYRDFTYTPCGGVCDTTNAALSGGTGKLTDGVSPTLDWYQQGELTSWVGWDSNQGQSNPSVIFNFAQAVTIDSVTVWLSNSRSGGVDLPASISVGGINHLVAPDTVSLVPRAVTFSGLNITGSSIDLQFFQSPSFSWVMVGEASFDGSAATTVPEPSTLALLGLGLAGFAASRRRKQ